MERFVKMITIEEAYQALADIQSQIPELTAGEPLATHEATGRFLAQPIVSRFDSPPFSQSAMDGVAFRAGHSSYKLVGTVAAGDIPDALLPGDGECVRIMTGAPVPSTADTVEMVEYINVSDDRVSLQKEVSPGQHIRVAGENLRVGERIYEAGTRITPGVLAGLLSQGVGTVRPYRRLRVGVAATGNEVIDYRHALQPGQIYNTNAFTVGALLAGPSISVSQLGTLGDHMEQTRDCLANNLEHDVLVLSGGVSMGNFDLVPEAAAAAGFRQVFHKIQMKPGKPVWVGVHPEGCVLFGLPGNPVSAMVGTMLFVRPFLEALNTGTFQPPKWVQCPVEGEIKNGGKLTLFRGVTLHSSLEGTSVRALNTSGSGDIIRFSSYQTLCRMPPQTSRKRGELVEVLLPFPSVIS